MKISVYNEIGKDHSHKKTELDVSVKNIPQVLSMLRHNYGDDFTDNIIHNQYCYILKNGSEAICLDASVIDCDISKFDELIICEIIDGDTGAEILLVLQILLVVVAIVSVVLSIVLAPDTSFNEDPSQEQGDSSKSSLFNGPPNIREQGGSVALVYGTAFSGGTLISAGIDTEDLGTI